MLSRKIKSRFVFLILALFSAVIVFFIILKSLEENIVYFLSPTEIHDQEDIILNENIRIGGVVKKNSLTADNRSINFIITDFNREIFVTYSGAVPNLFSEGKGVVAEGKLKDKKFFLAKRILAKHDENYMPPEVSEALNKVKK